MTIRCQPMTQIIYIYAKEPKIHHFAREVMKCSKHDMQILHVSNISDISTDVQTVLIFSEYAPDEVNIHLDDVIDFDMYPERAYALTKHD